MEKYITLEELAKFYVNGMQPIITEDADFEIIDNSNCVFNSKKIDERLIELGALEDGEFEIIKTKQQ